MGKTTVRDLKRRNIVGATADMGWGFHDRLSELFEQYFGE
jgi:hypothetical protein